MFSIFAFLEQFQELKCRPMQIFSLIKKSQVKIKRMIIEGRKKISTFMRLSRLFVFLFLHVMATMLTFFCSQFFPTPLLRLEIFYQYPYLRIPRFSILISFHLFYGATFLDDIHKTFSPTTFLLSFLHCFPFSSHICLFLASVSPYASLWCPFWRN